MDAEEIGENVAGEAPDQARAQFGERATKALEDLGGEFRIAGGEADYRLVFTQDRQQSVNRIVEFVVKLIGVTLFAADEAAENGRLKAASGLLADAGIETEQAEGRPFDAMPKHDGIVLGERAPLLSSFLFGAEAERVAAASVGPC